MESLCSSSNKRRRSKWGTPQGHCPNISGRYSVDPSIDNRELVSQKSCAVTNDGKVLCWGLDSLGNGTTCSSDKKENKVPSTAPTTVLIKGGNGAPLTDVVDVVASAHSVCALQKSGQLWCWGMHDAWLENNALLSLRFNFGLLGGNCEQNAGAGVCDAKSCAQCGFYCLGAVKVRTVQKTDFNNVKKIALGSFHGCALTKR